MRLHFDRAGVDKLLAHAKAAKEHGATYGQKPPIKPGLWLVGDQGIYLMSNGLPRLLEKASEPNGSVVVYPRECDPKSQPFETWYEVKRAAFGGDDGCDYLSAEDIDATLAGQAADEPFVIDLSPREMKLLTVTRGKRAK